jgi:hypothetical protein
LACKIFIINVLIPQQSHRPETYRHRRVLHFYS